jgi:hypothetical protein
MIIYGPRALRVHCQRAGHFVVFESLISSPNPRGDIMAKRTTLRSSKGTKLYAVRDKKGKFKDIQSYKKAHGQDIKRKSKAERAGKK